MESLRLDVIYQKDCLKGLRELPDNSIQCCVTSPPYWRLRDYNVAGQLGLEDTLEEYIANLVSVFEEVRRVLRPDGTFWLNIGDAYNGYKCNTGDTKYAGHYGRPVQKKGLSTTFLKPTDLIGIPWALAFALRSKGWYLRQEIIWHKRNGMPESVRSRCTRGHEHIFMFAKSAKYYYDADAIKTPLAESSRKDARLFSPDGYNRVKNYARNAGNGSVSTGVHKTSGLLPVARRRDKQNGYGKRHARFNERWEKRNREEALKKGANRRSVWSFPTSRYKGAHFATFPPALPETCIKAGSRPGDIILDPFLGSGTTAAVAKMLGRHYVGFELNDEYVKLARERLQAVKSLDQQ